MEEIKNLRRRDLSKDEKYRLEGEDMRETRELRHYYVSTITREVAKLKPPPVIRRKPTPAEEADANKTRERQEGLEQTLQLRPARNPSMGDAQGSAEGEQDPPQ